MRVIRVVTVCVVGALLLGAAEGEASKGMKIVEAARGQVGKTVKYEPGYKVIAYPNGDVPLEGGVCTDVVVRALRTGAGMDLQKLVHEDMAKNFAAYPKDWGLKRPDRNIDHRRVPNLRVFFKRSGWEVAVTKKGDDYAAGDLVTCLVGGKLPHVMVVSDRRSAAGVPLVLHNIGEGVREEDRLFEFELTGHFRVK